MCIHKIIFYDRFRVSPCKSEKKLFFLEDKKVFFLADADTCAGRDRGVPTLAAAGGWLLQGVNNNLLHIKNPVPVVVNSIQTLYLYLATGLTDGPGGFFHLFVPRGNLHKVPLKSQFGILMSVL